MNPRILPILSNLVLIAAFSIMFANTVVTGIAFSVTGILAMLYTDYGRNVEPLRARASAIPHAVIGGNPPELRRAA
ncbi:MAG: hypothetical protein WAN79_00370 [Opitutaceae bacterium]